MAMVAARAAIMAQRKRKQLIAKAQSVVRHEFDPKERQQLVTGLRQYESSYFLANVVEGMIKSIIVLRIRCSLICKHDV